MELDESTLVDIVERLLALNEKFKRVMAQIRLLNHEIKEKQVRYDRAYENDQMSWRYTLRIQIATLEGVKSMFLEYGFKLADDLEGLQNSFVQDGVLIVVRDRDTSYEESADESDDEQNDH